jgi:putative MATE family efflux protein
MKKGMLSDSDIFSGPIISATIRIGVPVFITQFFQLCLTFADTYFISIIDKKSTAIISGVGLVFPLFFLAIALGSGLFIGIGSLVARGLGEKNQQVIDRAADSGLAIALSVSAVFLIIGYLGAENILNMLAGDKITAEALRHAHDYLLYLLPGLALILVYNVLMGILQGEGLTIHLAIAMFIATIFNIVFDPIFIFSLKLGIKGAGLATSLSILVAFLYLSSVFILKKSSINIHWNLFKASSKLTKEIIIIGGTQCINMIIVSMGFMIYNKIVSSIGQKYMNSFSLVGRMDQICFTTIHAVFAATLTLAGQNYGRKNLSRVKDIFYRNLKFGIILNVIIVTIYQLIAPALFNLFSEVNDVVNQSIFQVRVLSYTTIFIGITVTAQSIFQATSKSLPILVLGFVPIIVFALPLAELFVFRYDMKLPGLFLAIGIANVGTSGIALLWVRNYLNKITTKELDS